MFGRLTRRSVLACATTFALVLVDGAALSGSGSAASRPQPARHVFAMHTSHVRIDHGAKYLGPEDCSRYYGQKLADDVPDAFGGRNSLAACGYTPKQLRGAYGVTGSGLSGAGVTVAIVAAYASPTMLADANRYARDHSERQFTAGQYREIVPSAYHHLDDGVCEAPSDWAVEEALDVEAVHAMAPKADIVYVASASCDDTDMVAALTAVVDRHLATIVSSSWGGIAHDTSGDEDPAVMAGYSRVFQRGAEQGIGFLFAAGDCGAEDPSTGCAADSSRPQTTYPAEDPWVTAVGGTTLAIGSDDAYLGEMGWGDERSLLSPDGAAWAPLPGEYRFGSGGGTSEEVPQPAYQRGKVPEDLATRLLTGAAAPRPMRTVPDVALDADPMTGFLVGVTERLPDGSVGYGESSIGGTSLATPLFAGIQADAQQAAGRPLGFLNPALYALAGTHALHDVTATSLDCLAPGPRRPLADVVDLGTDASGARQARLYRHGITGILAAMPGYDDVTGVGSPTGAYLHSYR